MLKAAPRLMTTTEVARALGVGVSSIKRWTDEGALETVRTRGGHRRYPIAAVHQFARREGLPIDALPPAGTIAETASEGIDLDAIRAAILQAVRTGEADVLYRHLVGAARDCRDLPGLLDVSVGRALDEIGQCWERGEVTVDQEHRASHAIASAVDALRPERNSSHSPLCVLAAPPGEQHELPLRMVRVLLERRGWRTDFLGADTPWDSVLSAARMMSARLVLLSAREGDMFRSREFGSLLKSTSALGSLVGIGGSWARGGPEQSRGVLRFRSLRGFERWLRSAEAPAVE